MKERLFLLLITAICLLTIGCDSNDDSFVVTNTGQETGTQVGVPARVAFVQNPAQVLNTDFSTPPIVEVQDVFGNRVTDSFVPISISLVNPGAAVLNGQTTRNADEGVAVFPGLSVSQTGSYSLTCSAPNLEGGTSALFTVESAPVKLLALSSELGNGTPVELLQLDAAAGNTLGSYGQIAGTTLDSTRDIASLNDGRVVILAGEGSNLSVIAQVNFSDISQPSILSSLDTFCYSLAYDSSTGTLYGLFSDNNTGRLHIGAINPDTGAITVPANDFGFNFSVGNGIAFDESSNTIFFANDDDLYSVEPATGIATLIGGGDTLDVVTAARGMKGLAVHPETNILYGATRGNAGASMDQSIFATIDKISGDSTQVTLTSSELVGFCFSSAGAVPDAPALTPSRR